jgi:hypothetical protein
VALGASLELEKAGIERAGRVAVRSAGPRTEVTHVEIPQALEVACPQGDVFDAGHAATPPVLGLATDAAQ